MNRLKYQAILCLCIASLIASGQDKIQSYVQQQAIQINSIQPEEQTYTDLLAIGNAVGDARIVMLGEQAHGDAAAFLAKARLIKYLHEEKGFTVLAFENDFFFTNYNWHLVRSGAISMEQFLKDNINPVWSKCTALNYFFSEYLPSTFKTQRVLEIAGFDNIMNTKLLLPMLDSFLQVLKIPMVQLPEYKNKIYPLLSTWYNYADDTITTNTIRSYYEVMKTQMLASLPKDDFWVLTVDNLSQLSNQFKNYTKDYWHKMNTRDEQMAANLKWLTEVKYAGKKVIVWAHNYHISKYAGHYPVKWANKASPMGTVLTTDSGISKKTYVVGFTSYQGTAGTFPAKIYKIEKPKPNSFENWVNKDFQYAFLDFTQFNAANPGTTQVFNMSGSTLGNNRYHTNYPAEWNKVFDGVFYIRDMYPCERE